MDFENFFEKAEYVSANGEYYFPYVRKSFYIEKGIKKATLFVSILGFGEVYVNGERLNEELYVSTYSQYNKQFPSDANALEDEAFFGDEVDYTIYVTSYDATSALKQGKNAVGFLVAGGWYRSGKDMYGNFRNYGKTGVCFRLVIETEDGEKTEVVSDMGCRFYESFLLEGGIFHEEQDERKEIVEFASADYDDRAWHAVEILKRPQAKYLPLDCPVNKVIREVEAKLVKQGKNYKIFDMGENLTGVPVILSSGKVGDKIVCRYSEEILDDGELNPKNVFAQETTFITDGRKEHKLRFTWHGFRYVQISSEQGDEGLDCKRCKVVHADVRNTSEFESDSEMLNWLYKAYECTQLCNYQCGVPTDCPQIERKGYTGDGQLLCELGMTMFDAKRLYKKWLRDIFDSQDQKSGFVQYTAPCFIGCAGGPGGWSVAIITVPYAYYKAYGEIEVLKEAYPYMKKYVGFMRDHMPCDLIIYKNRECLGDWNAPGRELIPSRFANTCMFVAALEKLIKIACVLGKEEDVAGYKQTIDCCKKAIDDAFFDENTGDYCWGEQAANAFALRIGLGDERTKKNLAARYRELKRFDTGIFGTRYLVEELIKLGETDVVYGLLDSDDFASYKTWKKKGATTLQEAWKYGRSHNHPMFGSPVLTYFTDILGIKQTEESAGYREIVIAPQVFSALKRVRGSILTERGRIAVAYEDTPCGRKFTVTIPEGVRAKFSFAGVKKELPCGKTEVVVAV